EPTAPRPCLCLLILERSPRPTPVPYTTLFRSVSCMRGARGSEGGRLPIPSTHQPKSGTGVRDVSDDGGVICVEPVDAGRLAVVRSEEHTSGLQSRENLVCRHLLEKKNNSCRLR